MGRGAAAFRHDVVDLGDVVVRRLELTHALFHEFRVEDGWTTLVLVARPPGPSVWNGEPNPAHGIGVLLSGRDHAATTPAGWPVIEVDVRNETLLEEVLTPGTYEWAERRGSPVLELTPGAASSARSSLEDHVLRARVPTRARALAILRSAIARSSATEIDVRDLRPDAIARSARRIIDRELPRNPPISSIARELGITMRSMQRDFVRAYHQTPKEYMLARRLHQTRLALRSAHRKMSIAEVAHAFGFSSPSRLAEQFARQFGHSPSALERPQDPGSR